MAVNDRTFALQSSVVHINQLYQLSTLKLVLVVIILHHRFMALMTNFNHERLVIAVAAARMARNCYEEAIMYAMKRKTFGKTLISHQIIRYKLVCVTERVCMCVLIVDR